MKGHIGVLVEELLYRRGFVHAQVIGNDVDGRVFRALRDPFFEEADEVLCRVPRGRLPDT